MTKLSLRKGNIVETSSGFIGKITKYSSNKEIFISQKLDHDKIITYSEYHGKIFTKEDIIKILQENEMVGDGIKVETISLQKGDVVRTNNNIEGTIVKYSSNKEIWIETAKNELCKVERVSIVKILDRKEVNKAQEKRIAVETAVIIGVDGVKVVIGDDVIFDDTPIEGKSRKGQKGKLRFLSNDNIFIWGDTFRRMLRRSEISSYNFKKI